MSALLLGRLQPRARRLARASIQGTVPKHIIESILFKENYYASSAGSLPVMTSSGVTAAGQLYTARNGGAQRYSGGEAPTGTDPAYCPVPERSG